MKHSHGALLAHPGLKALRLLAVLGIAAASAGQEEVRPFFLLASSHTFGSNGKPSINVSATNVTSLKFRVYRVNDPEKFFRQLDQAHDFSDYVAPSRDRRSLLERFHRWKSGLRADIRRSLRAQFTSPPSSHLAKFTGESSTPAATEGDALRRSSGAEPRSIGAHLRSASDQQEKVGAEHGGCSR